MNSYGFAGDDDPLDIDEDDVVVAVTGGSLAMRMFIDSRGLLKKRLKRIRRFRERDIKMVCLHEGIEPINILCVGRAAILRTQFPIEIMKDKRAAHARRKLAGRAIA